MSYLFLSCTERETLITSGKYMDFFKKIIAYFANLVGGTKSKGEALERGIKKEPETINKNFDFNTPYDPSITHNPDLVKNLKIDHQNLLKLYTDMLGDAKAMKFDGLSDQLTKFKVEFVAHLNTENTKFYGYLEQSLTENSEEFKEMRAFRRNMRTIESDVIKFLDYWVDAGIDVSNYKQFLDESSTIAGALISRIESEEKDLYPIYGQKAA